MRGSHQTQLDLVGGQGGILFKDQGDQAADHGGRLRAAGHDKVIRFDPEVAVAPGQDGLARDLAQQVTARGDQLGLDETLHGWPGGGERSQEVVIQGRGGVVIGQGADRNHIRNVARHADRHGRGTTVAGRGHHHDAGLPGTHHCLVERVIPVVGMRLAAERQVEHPDLVQLAVGDHPIDGADDIQVGACALGVEGLDGYQVGVGRHTIVAAGWIGLGAQHQAGDM